MITKKLKPMTFCLLLILVAGIISPAANAQDVNSQSPLLLIRIRNVERLIGDLGRLMPQSANQLASVRMMLQGTDWIDTERSITVGFIQEGVTSRGVVLIPFRTANAAFQMTLSAKARQDYYVALIPPQGNSEVSPAIEEILRKASLEPVFGSISMEASAGRMLAMIGPQLDAAFKNMQITQPPQTGQSAMPPVDPRALLSDMLDVLRQMETLRLGMSLDDNVLTLQYDMDAMPNSLLAGILIDPGRDTRLMNYPMDLPFQFRSRAPDMSGMMEMTKLVYGQMYRQLGVNLDEMMELTVNFTGELAGGIGIDSRGLALEAIYVLKPGINGKDFVQKTYLPWIERYGRQLSELAAKQNVTLQEPIYKRTADSLVDGVEVIGIKPNLGALMPPGGKEALVLEKLAIEMRMAAVGDLMFVASDDVKMAEVIKKARRLAMAPAQGPTTLVTIKLGSLINEMQSFMAVKGDLAALPDNLGDLTIKAEARDGKLTTRTSLNIDEIRKLVSAFQAQTAKK